MPLPKVKEKPARQTRAARRPDKVLSYVLASPWAISEEGLHKVLAVASRLTISPEALERMAGEPLANTQNVSVREGIATIPIHGPLVKRASWFDAISGATSYESIARDLATAADDPRVTAIILSIDSPGGEVSGCSELAHHIREVVATGKPVHAYIGGAGCSAAYWLASGCTRVHVSNTALVGCLGCRMTVIDDSEALERAGIERIEIVSSQTPDKAMDPATPEGHARALAILNQLAGVFLADVALGRRVTVEHVIAHYGRGDMFVGAVAVERGLADAVSTYEAVHASLHADERRLSSTTTEEPMPAPKTTARMRPRAPLAAAAAITAAMFEPEAEVRSLVARDVGIGEGDVGVISEVREGVFYGVAIGDSAYLWMAEEELEAAEPADSPAEPTDPPTEPAAPAPAAARVAARLQIAGATAERARITSILAYAPRFGLEALLPFLHDASMTKDKVAARLLDLPATTADKRLRALKADDAHVAAANVAATDTGAAGDEKNGSARMLANYARVSPTSVPLPFRRPTK